MRGVATVAAESAPQAPPRRQGRSCGYEHQPELLAATRALGAALHRLARDPDPAARATGAHIAATVAGLVGQAAAVAADSTSPARRAEADVARRLPRLLADLEAARAQLHHHQEGPR